MKQHFCSAENSLIEYEKECNWCGEKEWVGLTKDDIESWELPDAPTVAEFAWFVEAKLKEKNT